MREALKDILRGCGTPVLQTRESGEETILSAGNIWTSAHARRIELRERGLAPGGVLCGDMGGFQAVIDFVACAIGGFVYLPVTSADLCRLRHHAAANPVASRTGIAFASQGSAWQHHADCIPGCLAGITGVDGAVLILSGKPPGTGRGHHVLTGSDIDAWLARLSAQWETPEWGTRLSYRPEHHGPGFVTDLLLGISKRQTIYLRTGAQTSASRMIDEILGLEVDDLVLVPSMLDDLCREASRLSLSCRMALRRVRCHIAGRIPITPCAQQASQLFGRVFVTGQA